MPVEIVYLVDEPGEVERFGFAYGTLPDHAERGEELFTVEWRHADDSVWYDLLSYSQPNHQLARLAGPIARQTQKRFAARLEARYEASCRRRGNTIDKN